MSERERVTSDEVAFDMPLQVHSLERLSQRERARYRRARSLLASGSGVRALLVEDIPLAGLGVYEALLAESWTLRFSRPEEMVRLTDAALAVAQDFGCRRIGRQRIADLQARAWGELANAYRIKDRLWQAQEAFGQAYALLDKGTGDPYLKARLFDLEASFLGKWREFPLALNRLKTLSNLYLELGEPHLAGRTFIIRALYTYYSGAAEEALLHNEEGLKLIDRSQDPALLMFALHNEILFLVELHLYPQAKRVLFESRRHLIYKDRINVLRLRGIEGRISYGLGEFASAEIAFREIREGFGEMGLSFVSAIASLDLAATLTSQDRTKEAAQEVLFARRIFSSLAVYREYLGTIIYLQECFELNEATPELIEFIIAYLWRKELQRPPRHPQ